MLSKFLIILLLPLHIFLLYSIFDIYFTSPLIKNIQPVNVAHEALSKRLVFIVIDGLRANKLYENSMELTPFLKSKLFQGNPWGLSNTHVPTETRPGHVALIAGFYEDVSSITKGWQENAVEFDSVFNRSYKTWAWGSPDVLPMFDKGVTNNKVLSNYYSADLEDFSGNNTWQLDTWVFNEFKMFLNSSNKSPGLKAELKHGGVVLFLHLLGIDVSGHSQKPNSESYNQNLKIVDRGLETIQRLIDDFYSDNNTAFIVTSDHGMTNWGSHGDGTLDETVTPIMAWGSGLRKYKKATKFQFPAFLEKFLNKNPEISQNFPPQHDIWQADICPLMSALLGIQIPINSVGIVPIDYLDADDHKKSLILRSNIYQLFVQFKAKLESRKQSRLFLFQEFPSLSLNDALDKLDLADQLLRQEKYTEAIDFYRQFSKILLNGLDYYHKYNQLWLGFLISLTFILWIIMLSSYLVPVNNLIPLKYAKLKYLLLNIFILISIIYNLYEMQPISYIFYETIPLIFLFYLYNYRRNQVQALFKVLKKHIMFLFAGFLLIESMVWSFFYRPLLIIGLLIVYTVTVCFTYHRTNQTELIKWTIGCGLLIIFPNLPIIGANNNQDIVFLGGVICAFYSIYMSFFNKTDVMKDGQKYQLSRFHNLVMISLQIYTSFHVYYCHYLVEIGTNTSYLIHANSWVIYISALPLAILSSKDQYSRLIMIQSAFITIYNLVGIYYEMLFLMSLLVFCNAWQSITISYRQKSPSSNQVNQLNVINTVFYVFLLTYSFFATGNIASINSFDLKSTYCFVTVFSPFVMMTLMISKLVIPIFIISLTYDCIQQESPTSLSSRSSSRDVILCTVLADIAALHFLFLIKDSGSWLQIGTSISHYVISMSISFFTTLCTFLASVVLTWNLNTTPIHKIE